MEIIGLNALIAAIEDVPENSTQLNSLRGLRKMFENNIIKPQDSIETTKILYASSKEELGKDHFGRGRHENESQR